MEQNKKPENVINTRKLSLDLLMDIMENGAFCDKCIHNAFDQHELERRDKGFIMRLVEGTVERCIELDYIINQFSKVKVKKMKPVIRNILRMSVYQIFYMEQVPDSAACNEAVKLTVKRKLQNLKGFVNGVLRNIVRNKDAITYPKKGTIEYLCIQYSMPEWIVKQFADAYGLEDSEEILQSFMKEKGCISVRCTTSRYTTDVVRKTLEEQGVLVEKGALLDNALILKEYSNLTGLKAFQKGMFQVQDESSMLVGAIAGVKPDDTVIDVCAAPGGKTLHMADILRGSGQVISADLTADKTKLIRENSNRLGYQNITVVENDALIYREEWKDKADVLIADLPCSGLGVIGKKCDIKYKTKKEDIDALAQIQRQILKVVSTYVKKGGRLLFSTCTIAARENEENVAWIEENLPFHLISIEENLPDVLKGKTGDKGYLQVLPQMAGTDGFFLSCFEKE